MDKGTDSIAPSTQGFIDLHVHAAPSLFPRNTNAEQLVELCRQAGYRALVLKAHHGSTVEIASLLNQSHQDIHVYGGVVLNSFVGGLNPWAVESALALGAKVVWMPTIHAQFHGKACGCLGGFSFQKSDSPVSSPETGISLLDENSRLCPEVQDILSLMHNSGCILATGHVSPREIIALSNAINIHKLNIPLLVNHVFFNAPNLGRGELQKLQGENVWFETSHLSTSPLTKAADIKQVAETIKTLPDLNWVLVSDSGQKEGYTSPKALQEFSTQLMNHGVDKQKVKQYLTTNPSRLLQLEGEL